MNLICEKCKSEVVGINFSEEQKLEIWALIAQDLKLFAIKKIRDEYKLSLRDAKIIGAHLNKEFGKCHRCDYEGLEGENIVCPKCKSFNYNLKMEHQFNEEFCNQLEWKLDFKELEDERLKGFWCDGVDHIPMKPVNLSQLRIRINKEIKTKAWIGKDGQDIYEMTIKLGEKSLANYELKQSLIDCIPEGNYKKWIKVDPEIKIIEVKLN